MHDPIATGRRAALRAVAVQAIVALLVAAGMLLSAGLEQGLAAAASYFVIGALSFGVWQEWWLGLAAMTAIWVMISDARLAPKYDTMIEA